MELKDYLPCGMTLDLNQSIPTIWAKTRSDAEDFLEISIKDLIKSAVYLGKPIQLRWKGCKRPFNISPKLASLQEDNQQLKPLQPNEKLMIELASKQDIDNATNRDLLVAIEDCPESAAITRIRESKVLACSNLIQNTNGKPPDEVIGSSLDSLWHPDQLDQLMRFLEQDGRVENYEYWCWKWHLENGLWVRKRQNLAAKIFQLVQFKGVQCRLSLGVTPV
ncbi:MAG: PAS domain-containing protein [Planktothrix sp.]|uniref:PAS domain-containing protein n=1 Tax=Planktothrix sp. TaxID=3088171 RepID=UPI0038D48A39